MNLSFLAEQNGSTNERPSIVVVDAHSLSRSCLARILQGEFPGFDVLKVDSARQFDSMTRKNIRLVALNIGSAALTDERVLECLAHLRRTLPETLLMLVTQLTEETISDAMIAEVNRYGVSGYLTDSASVEIAVAAFRLVLAGGIYFPRHVLTDCVTTADPSSDIGIRQRALAVDGKAHGSNGTADGSNSEAGGSNDTTHEYAALGGNGRVAFTERERQVLASLLRGLSNKVIASELNLSQNTIKSHISHIMRKLRATNRTEVVIFSQSSLHAPEISRTSIGQLASLEVESQPAQS